MKYIVAQQTFWSPDTREKTGKIIPIGTKGTVTTKATGWAVVKWDGLCTQTVDLVALRPFVVTAEPPAPTPVFLSDPIPEPEQFKDKDHPWTPFDEWHKDVHNGCNLAPIEWPCRQPIRCLWRYTREEGAMLDQYGVVGTYDWERGRSRQKLPLMFSVGGHKRRKSGGAKP